MQRSMSRFPVYRAPLYIRATHVHEYSEKHVERVELGEIIFSKRGAVQPAEYIPAGGPDGAGGGSAPTNY